MQRHLAAFEALDAHARTRGLALAAATAGLALPGPDAAADAHAPLAGPRIVGNLIELHGTFPMRTTEDRRRRTDNFLLLSSVVRRLSSDYAHEMRDFGDHPACGRRVLQLADATDAIESEADKGLALVVAAPGRTADLLDLDGLPGGRIRCRHWRTPQTSLFGGSSFGIGVATARLQRRHLDVSPRRDCARRVLALQGVEGRSHHVVGVRGADGFRHHVLHTERLEHRPHRAAGDDAGTRRRGAQEHLAGAVAALHVVMERAPFPKRHPHQAALGRVGRLADRFRHFTRLAVTKADPALLVADHDQRCEAEAPAALHHLGNPVDVDKLVGELAVLLFPVSMFAFTCHNEYPSLEFQPALARSVRQGLDAAVVEVVAAIEHHILHAGRRRAFGDTLAHRLDGADIGSGLEAGAHILFER